MRIVLTGNVPECTARLYSSEDETARLLVERTRQDFETALSSVAFWINVRLRGTEDQVEAFAALSRYVSGGKAVREELARMRGGYDAERLAAAEAKEREARRTKASEASQTLGMSGMGSGLVWR